MEMKQVWIKLVGSGLRLDKGYIRMMGYFLKIRVNFDLFGDFHTKRGMIDKFCNGRGKKNIILTVRV